MTTSKLRSNSAMFIIVVLAFALLPASATGQDGCAGAAPPEDNLYLIPEGILQGYDFSPHGISLIHDYGLMYLAHLASLSGIPENIQDQITGPLNVSTISFRDYSLEFATPSFVDAAALGEGVFFMALFGPLDAPVLDLLRSAGIIVLGSAHPHGLLIKGDRESLDAALGICTSEGYRLVRAVFPAPLEIRLSPTLLRIANGEAFDLDGSNLVHADNGRLVVRIFPFEDGCGAETLASVSGYLEMAAAGLDSGYNDAFLIAPEQIIFILYSVGGIGYLEPLAHGGSSANIAVTGDILNISPVWTETNYQGDGVTILLNELGGVDYRHKDLCTAHYSPCSITDSLVKDFLGWMLDSEVDDAPPGFHLPNAHGTHVAGLLAGRGWDLFPGESDALCRPLSEEDAPELQTHCGEYSARNDFIKGAAPKAWLIANEAENRPPYINDEGKKNIPEMMEWGYAWALQGARISSNSWWREDEAEFGGYESPAAEVDKAVRDAVPDSGAPGTAGNQEMLIVYSAGNNDYMGRDEEDKNQETRVQCPGVAKNALTVGATENARCGFARNYDCAGYSWDPGCDTDGCYRCDLKVQRPPDPKIIYERSGRGPSQERVKPDIVAVGADVISAQSLIDSGLLSRICA